MTSLVKRQASCTSVDTVNERAQAFALLDAGLGVMDVAKQQ